MKDKMTLGEKAQELARVVTESVKAPTEAVATHEAIAARRKICDLCPSGKKRGRRCSVCSCNVYVKTVFAKAECPLGHWGQIEDSS